MNSNPESDVEAESEVNEVADSLAEGDEVVFNDRVIPLEVTGRREKQITKTHRKQQGERDHYDIIVLDGNGTVYHLLWQHGSGVNPILRKQSEWTEKRVEGGGVEYDYSSRGDRVTSIEVVDEA